MNGLAGMAVLVMAAGDPWPRLEAVAGKLRPTAAESRWASLPWHTDPDAAFAEAERETRPVFVWVAGGRGRDGSPLERC